MQTYEPLAGTRISNACAVAVQMAIEGGDEVAFTFNGIAMRALPTDRPEALVERWGVILDEQHEAYRNSPEGRKAQADRDAAITNKQAKVNACIETLPKILRVENHLDALMKWLREFIEPTDDVGVKWDSAAVTSALEAAGYRSNAHVGHAPEWFDCRKVMGEYVIGQAISCMESGMPPHPIALKFIDQYFAMPSESERSSSV